MKEMALRALKPDELQEIMEMAGAMGSGNEAGAALKAVMAERIVEYTAKAMKEARKRKISVGPAAIIIASK